VEQLFRPAVKRAGKSGLAIELDRVRKAVLRNV
jgi:hypothetical protein